MENTVGNCRSEEMLTKTEQKLYRKKVGQLSWLASKKRPDLSFHVQALSQKQSKPTMEDLKKINSVITLAKRAKWCSNT